MTSGNLRMLLKTAALALLAGGCALGQNPPVPSVFQATFTQLGKYVADFDSTVSSQWDGTTGNTLFASDLLFANANRGLQLLNAPGITYQLDALQALGVKAVTVTMGFPILDQNFYTFNGDPNDFNAIVTVYANLSADIHKRGMKMIAESAVLFPGYFSTGSGFKDLTGYYAGLSDDQFVAARVRNILTIVQQVKPDYINLNSEPDTDLSLSNKSGLYGSAAAYAAMVKTMVTQLRAAGVTIPLGAGVGTWLKNGHAEDYVTALLGTGIDYLDLHVYAVNFNYLPQAITYANMAQQAGKKVAISEAWCLKQSDSELSSLSASTAVAAEPEIYARDPYSFWAPLDQAFLQALVKFANWKNLIYFSPFWSQYYWSYLDYDKVQNLPFDQVSSQAVTAASTAMRTNQTTSTGKAFSTMIGGPLTPQAATVSAASFATVGGNLAPDSMVSIFGSGLSSDTVKANDLPLPTLLAGTSAVITDSTGNQQPVPLLFVAPTQINAALPPGLSSGPAVIDISSNQSIVAQSKINLSAVAPAFFTANQTGKGAVIGIVVTAHADGTQTYVLTFQGSPGSYTPAPIDLGAPGDQSVLILYGTGIRNRSSLAKVQASIGSITAPVDYAGPCDPAHYVAFDQVNVTLPRTLAGAGQVNVSVTADGATSNTVTLNFK